MCKDKKIEVVFVSPPFHKNYTNNIPETVLTKYNELRSKFSKDYLFINKMSDSS